VAGRCSDATEAERRFLIGLDRVGAAGGPTVGQFLIEWLVQSAPTRRETTAGVARVTCVRDHVIPHLTTSVGVVDDGRQVSLGRVHLTHEPRTAWPRTGIMTFGRCATRPFAVQVAL
jgi:hypothetical protein